MKVFRNAFRRLARCFWRRPSSSASAETFGELAALYDMSGAADFAPTVDMHPEPRQMQRAIRELTTRVTAIESYLSKRDKRFTPWMTL